MFNTTEVTRRESDKTVDRQKRYAQIREVLAGKDMTAKEVAVEMHRRQMIPTTERNFTAPRLTEMAAAHEVEVIGKRKCSYTGKTVAVYHLTAGK